MIRGGVPGDATPSNGRAGFVAGLPFTRMISKAGYDAAPASAAAGTAKSTSTLRGEEYGIAADLIGHMGLSERPLC